MLKKNIITILITLSIGINAQEHNILVPMLKNNKYGAINLNRKVIIPFEFDNISLYLKNTYLVEKNNLRGLYNSNGIQLLSCRFNSIKPIGDNSFIVKKDGEVGVIKKNDKIIIPISFKSIISKSDSRLYIIKNKNNKSALYSKDGKQIIPFEFDNISFYNNNNLLFARNSKYALATNAYNLNNLKFYDNIMKFGSGYLVINNNKQGLLSNLGNEVIPCKYDDLKFINNSVVGVSKTEKKYAFFSYKGEKLSKFRYYEPFYYFNNNIIWTNNNDILISYNILNKEEEPIKIDRILEKQNGYMRIIKHNYVSLIDKDGNELFSNTYQNITPLNNGFFKVQFDRKWGIIDSLKELIIPIIYDEIRTSVNISNSYIDNRLESKEELETTNNYNKVFIVEKSGKKGVYNTKGIQIIPTEYDNIGVNQKDKLIWVEQKDKFGVFSRQGIKILSAKYTNITWNEFQNRISIKDSIGYKIVTEYGDISELKKISNLKWANKKGLFYSEIDDKIGLFRLDGKNIIPNKYDELYDFDKHLIIGTIADNLYIFNKDGSTFGNQNYSLIHPANVFKGESFYTVMNLYGKNGVINSMGEMIIPIKYDEIIFEKNGLFKIINNHKFIGYFSISGDKYF